MSNEYKDQGTPKVLTRKDIIITSIRTYFLGTIFTAESFQSVGWTFSLFPALKKIHKNEDDLQESIRGHLEFFNTAPWVVSFVTSLILAMEENKQSPDSIRAIKTTAMSAGGGIGDALFWFTALPITVTLTVGIGMAGSPLGALLFFIAFNALQFTTKILLGLYGYKIGTTSLASFKKTKDRFTHAVTSLAILIISALIVQFVRFETPYSLMTSKGPIKLQEALFDNIMPKLLPVLLALVTIWLIKKKQNPLNLVLLFIVIGLVGSFFGIL